MYNNTFYSYGFPEFMGLIKDISERTKMLKHQEELEKAGVVFNKFFGVPAKNIPSVYNNIDFVNNRFYICDKFDESAKSDVFNEEGNFLFTAYRNTINYLGYGEFFLFKDPEEGKEEKIHYSLFYSIGDEYVIEGAIYRPILWTKFKENSEFCIIGNAVTYGKLVINKSGEIVYEDESKGLSTLYLYNNVLHSGNSYINLFNNEVICDGVCGTSLDTGNLMFVKSYGQVFKIDTITGEYEVFGESTKDKPTSPPQPTSPPTPKKKKVVAPKQNRNDLCNCGSGKKFKNCCGK